MSTPNLSGIQEELYKALMKEIEPYAKALMENVGRCVRLMTESNKLEQDAGQDLIRASVVLTHAVLEDFLRTLAVNILPSRDEETLNDVPLAGLEGSGRAAKFFLGKLVRHRGKSVDDVIRESVSLQMDRSSINSTDDIAKLLREMGLDPLPYAHFFPDIDSMIQRRHAIVHRGDKPQLGRLTPTHQLRNGLPVDSDDLPVHVPASRASLLRAASSRRTGTEAQYQD